MDIGQYTMVEAHHRPDIFDGLRAAEVPVAHDFVVVVRRIGLESQCLGNIVFPYGGIIPVLAGQGYGIDDMRGSGV